MTKKTELIYKKGKILGVDLGTTSIKIAQLHRKKGLVHLTGCGISDATTTFNSDGSIADPKAVAQNISSLIKNPKWGEITADKVNFSLPELKAFTRMLELPKMSEAEMKEAVKWEAEQYIPTSAEELYLDWEILGERTKGRDIVTEVMMVAIPKKVVDSYISVMDLLGLKSYSAEIGLSAVTRSMISNKTKDEVIIVLDIGGKSTSIAVFDHDIIVTGSIPVGGEKAVEATKDKAVVLPEIDTMVDEIKKLISYYEGKKAGKKIARTLLCGGSASIPGLSEELSSKIGLPVKVGNPWTNISTYPLKPIPKAESPRYANAIGLALLGVIDE